MENEQVLETTIQEPTEKEALSSSENKEEKTIEENEWKAPTKEEYEKALKSSASKAKFQILQELNVKSVDDFKAKSQTIENSLKELDDIKKENNRLKEDLLIKELNISDDYRDDFLTLAKAKATDTQDLKSVATEILNKNPAWVKNSEPIKIGNEKSDIKHGEQSFLSNKYKWLKG